jgi:hypothetical protein
MKSGEGEQHFPAHLQGLSAFQRVLLVQALRPDRLHTMLQIFAQKTLGNVHLCSKQLQLLVFLTLYRTS